MLSSLLAKCGRQPRTYLQQVSVLILGVRMKTTQHAPWLDWIRFLAAMLVLAEHARGGFLGDFGNLPSEQRTPLVAAAFGLTRLGNQAVIIFFVLSGYLVGGRTLARLLSGQFRTADYAIDRVARIYVPYIPALALTWVCSAVVGIDVDILTLIMNVFCLQGIWGGSFGNNAPLWSIAYEVWFYILAGAIGAFATSRDRGSAWTALAFVTTIVSLGVFTVLSSTYLFCWLVGAAAYFARLNRIPIATTSLLALGVSTLGILLTSPSQFGRLASVAQFLPQLEIFQLTMAASGAALISTIVNLQPQSTALCRLDRLGSRLASFSYTLYLIHWPVLGVINTYLLPKRNEISLISIGSFIAGCTLAILASVVMYFLFERHTVALRRRFHAWLKPAAQEPEQESAGQLALSKVP